MNDLQKGILTLVRSAITGEKLPLPAGFRLEEADRLIRDHSLLPLAYQGAYNCGISPKEPLMQEYQKLYFAILMRHERQRRAIEQVFRAFEERGIDYLPLKGCVMKPLYPNPELRIMADADILIRLEQRQQIVEILPDLGFEEKDESYHEWVWRHPDLLLELHKCLFAEVERDFHPVFGDGWQMAVSQTGHRYGLPPEESFVFLFAHMVKHYRLSGIGIRHFADLYVFRRAHPEMEEEKICRMMKRLRLLEFYRNTSHLLQVWFGKREPDEKTEIMTRYIFASGNWGDQETAFTLVQVKAGRKKHTRAAALLRAVFPPLEQLRYDYGILFRYPWLYPLFYPVRWVTGIFTRPRRILSKFRILARMSDEKVRTQREEMELLGLEFD